MPIRVLHVLGELRASGAEVAMRAAADHWRHAGIVCDILSTGDTPGHFRGALQDCGYQIHHIPLRPAHRFLPGYFRLLSSEKYDVVHVHRERASFYTSLGSRLAGARTVVTVRNNFFFGGYLRWERTVQRCIARALGTTFIAVSPSVARTERVRFRNQALHIDNWIDIDKFQVPTSEERDSARAGYRIPVGALAIVSVGNCSDVKNHASLLRALARVKSTDWVWLHVGTGPAGQTEYDLAVELGVSSRCRFLGPVDPLCALHAADWYAMPSLREGIGMATIEALATGLPVLLTDVAGTRDLEELAQHAIWCAPTPDSIFCGLQELATTPMPRMTAWDAAAQRDAVVSRFSPAVGVANYARIYRQS